MFESLHPNLLALFAAILLAVANILYRDSLRELSPAVASFVTHLVMGFIACGVYAASGGVEKWPLIGILWFLLAGLVGHQDVDDSGKLSIEWPWMELVLTPEDGEATPKPLPTEMPFEVEANTALGMRGFVKSKSLELGSLIELTPDELAEICFFVHTSANQVHNSAVEYTRRAGIQVVDKKETRESQQCTESSPSPPKSDS
jgi:hypothetical protein